MTLSPRQAAQITANIIDTMGSTVSVETYSGESGYGPLYAAAVSVVCNVQSSRKLVRNSSGDEVVSETTLHVAPDDAAAFTPETRVTISSKVSTVITSSPKTYRGEVVYIEVTCT